MSRTLLQDGAKRCARCRRPRPVAEFQVHRDEKGVRLHAYCRDCMAAYRREWRAAKPRPKSKSGPKRPAPRRTCPKCKVTKATVAFWGGAEVCRACTTKATLGTHYERKVKRVSEHRTIEVRHTRVSFDVHMESFGATREDYMLVRRALARYGMRGPSPDDVVEEYLRTHRNRTHSDLFHGVVLAANEQGVRGYANRRHAERRAA